jgi:hypothetical protein
MLRPVKIQKKAKAPFTFCKRGFFIALSKYWDTAAMTYGRTKSKNKNVSQFKNSQNIKIIKYFL